MLSEKELQLKCKDFTDCYQCPLHNKYSVCKIAQQEKDTNFYNVVRLIKFAYKDLADVKLENRE